LWRGWKVKEGKQARMRHEITIKKLILIMKSNANVLTSFIIYYYA